MVILLTFTEFAAKRMTIQNVMSRNSILGVLYRNKGFKIKVSVGMFFCLCEHFQL